MQANPWRFDPAKLPRFWGFIAERWRVSRPRADRLSVRESPGDLRSIELMICGRGWPIKCTLNRDAKGRVLDDAQTNFSRNSEVHDADCDYVARAPAEAA